MCQMSSYTKLNFPEKSMPYSEYKVLYYTTQNHSDVTINKF